MLWTIFFLFIYCLGNRLVLPFVDLKNTNIFGGSMGSLGFSSAMMGGNLSSMSLFFSRLVTLDVNALMVTSITSRKMVANLRGKVSKKWH
ncbi:protein of unknown function [Streptococcus thermophilus]|nr:protein of unknown function [Streptococcus thermophilus]CAD0150433.1 protein of unknown function [Streptococcus thermophilus]